MTRSLLASRVFAARELQGCLFTFSGIEGAGKSTIVRQLVSQLAGFGQNPAVIWSRPGYTPGLSLLKRMVRPAQRARRSVRHEYPVRAASFRNGLMRRVWLTASLLDLLWVYGVRVRWYLNQGRFVICDRYLTDARIDMITNFSEDRVESWLLWRLVEWLAPKPTHQFIVLVPLDLSLKRYAKRAGGNIDSHVAEILSQRLKHYTSLMGSEPLTVLDGSHPLSVNLTVVHSLIEAQNAE